MWGVVFCALLFFLVAAFAVVAKYFAVAYNAIDLAIFSQTVHQTAFGVPFGLTIHPHNYLGDHASYALVLFAPLYRILTHPLTLLLLQAGVLASSVFPLWRLMRRFLKRTIFRYAMLIAFALHPFLHSYALFEFELLVFSVPLLLWTIVAYEERRFCLFLFLLAGLALVREDLGLVLLGFAALAWLQRRSVRWTFAPVLLGLLTVLAGGIVTAYVNGEHYKFLMYYSWIVDLHKHPSLLLSILFRPQNILLLIGLLLLASPFALRKPSYLLPAALPLLSFLLMGSAPTLLELRTHYTALVFPFLLWASLAAVQAWEERPPHFFARLFLRPASAFVLLFAVASVYGFFTMSPLRPNALWKLAQAAKSNDAKLARAFLSEVKNDKYIAAGLRFLPHLAEKPGLYSMVYVSRGKRQLSERPYELPAQASTLLLDASDAVAAYLQHGDTDERFTGSANRLRSLITERNFRVAKTLDTFLLLRKGGAENFALFEEGKKEAVAIEPLDGNIQLLASRADGQLDITQEKIGNQTFSVLPLSLTWRKIRDDKTTYHLRLRFIDERGRVRNERILPFAAGLFPPPEWPTNTPITIPFSVLVPKLPNGTYRVTVEPVALTGYLGLNAILSAQPVFRDIRSLATYPLGTIAIIEPDRS